MAFLCQTSNGNNQPTNTKIKENSISKEKRFVIQVDPLEIEDDAIFDNKELRLYECQSDMMSDICSLLNKQDQRIAELEKQLKNAIVPKFKIGQTVYTFNKYNWCVYELKVISIHISKYENINFNSLSYSVKRLEDGFTCGYLEDDLFNTKEEAEAKLKEMMKSE